MSLEKLFIAAVREMRERNIIFAVAGGLAADLYRREPRLTMDVDLVILTEGSGTEIAISVLKTLGLQAGIARAADLAGGPLFAIRRRNTPPCIIVGRAKENLFPEGVDILLPSLPWAKDAVSRAQANQVDFGFGPVPALTLEDVILSKLYCLMASPIRAKDLDDLQSVFSANHDIDLPYLAGQMQRFKIIIPKTAKVFLPKQILQLSRGGQSVAR
ncbi:MAG: hypothetical protein WCI95_06355 [bacterium]